MNSSKSKAQIEFATKNNIPILNLDLGRDQMNSNLPLTCNCTKPNLLIYKDNSVVCSICGKLVSQDRLLGRDRDNSKENQ